MIRKAAAAGVTPLQACAIAGDRGCCEALLATGADVDDASIGGAPPLHFAIAAGATEVVACLLSHGADLHRQGPGGRTGLEVAMESGDEEIANLIADSRLSAAEKNAALVFALRAGRFDLADRLIRRQAPARGCPGAEDLGGGDVLVEAVSNGRAEVVEFLLARECEPSAVDRESLAPLDHAEADDKRAVRILLLRAGADPMDRDASGWCSFWRAVVGLHVEAVRDYVSHGVDLTSRLQVTGAEAEYDGLTLEEAVVHSIGRMTPDDELAADLAEGYRQVGVDPPLEEIASSLGEDAGTAAERGAAIVEMLGGMTRRNGRDRRR
ncbi:MAG: ankyrin repeat domain-containing protein [Candidatus Eisenbacteria bacterium]|uniref:Ankyrin repeat domain-containing protein n=1 Tax=Eiseniibacteriota bacterium TaxID=2212470 RepID=A0A956NHD6_UNCEI|nr:ankyrin repeat domain-containing protein [Candidatus Eisenbacteria bacterium]